MNWNWKKKLLLDALVFLLAGAACTVAFGLLEGHWGWGLCAFMFLWPMVPMAIIRDCMVNGCVFWLNPLFWLPLAGVLIWLFVRQFRRTDFRSVCLAAVSVAAWWLSGLFWMWALSSWE